VQLNLALQKGQIKEWIFRLSYTALNLLKSELQLKKDLPKALKTLIIILYLCGFLNHVCCEREGTMLAGGCSSLLFFANTKTLYYN